MTTAQIDDWLRALELSPQSRNNYRTVINNLFNFAVSRGYAVANPVERTAEAKVKRGAPEILTCTQAVALLNACDAETLPYVAISLFAGLRAAEAERLDWSEVDLDGGHIEVKGAKAKTGARLFTSDNGPEITGEVNPGAYDRAQQFKHYSMGDLRGAKRDTWEGGHRVPFLVRWPGKIKPGAVNTETICHVDFMATVAALLGAHLPPNAGEDSFNLFPLLLGEEHAQPVRAATVHHSGSGNFAIRKGDWVLIDAPSGDDNGAKGEPKWLMDKRGYAKHVQRGELFNVRDDVSERRNQFSEHPEVVRELKELLEKYKRDGRSTPGAPQKNDVEVGGTPATASSNPKAE